jgi:hypothetical protein
MYLYFPIQSLPLKKSSDIVSVHKYLLIFPQIAAFDSENFYLVLRSNTSLATLYWIYLSWVTISVTVFFLVTPSPLVPTRYHWSCRCIGWDRLDRTREMAREPTWYGPLAVKLSMSKDILAPRFICSLNLKLRATWFRPLSRHSGRKRRTSITSTLLYNAGGVYGGLVYHRQSFTFMSMMSLCVSIDLHSNFIFSWCRIVINSRFASGHGFRAKLNGTTTHMSNIGCEIQTMKCLWGAMGIKTSTPQEFYFDGKLLDCGCIDIMTHIFTVKHT